MVTSSFPLFRFALVVLLVVATLVAFHFSGSVNSVTESGVVMELPTCVGGFSGTDQPLSEGEKFVLPKDTEIVKKTYSDSTGDAVNAQIVLAGSEKRSIHRPELCLPAQGWSINKREIVPVTLADGRSISVMEVSISRAVETSPGITHPLNSYYDYWFVGNGVSTPSHVTRILLNSWDRVVHHKNHRWAYVAVSAPVLEGFKREGKNAEQTKKMITEFISQMAPGVMKYDGAKAKNSKQPRD